MDIKELKRQVIDFRDMRDWGKYHNPKDLAISIALEASELLEIFQWKSESEVKNMNSKPEIRKKVKEELGDIMIYALTLAHEFGLDPADIILHKIKINEQKYPVDKVKGRADKYTSYQDRK